MHRAFVVYFMLLATALLCRSATTAQTIKADTGSIIRYTAEAQQYFDKGKYDMAVQYGKQALAQLPVNDHQYAPSVYKLLANTSQVQGHLEQAINYYQSALKYNRDTVLKAEIYIAMTALYVYLGQKASALQYANQSLRITQTLNKPLLLAKAMLNKSQYHSMTADLKGSNKYLDSALKIAVRYDLKVVKHGALSNMGYNHLLNHEPRKALYFLLQTQPADSSINRFYQLAPLRMLGEAYFQMREYERAAYYLLKVIEAAEKEGIRKEAFLSHKLITEVYQQMGNYQEAFKHQSIYIKMKDSLANQEITTNINTLEAKYNSAEKDKHIVQQQLKITTQEHNIDKKNIWIGTIAAGTVLLVILLLALFINYRNTRRLQSSQIHILQQQQDILSKEARIRELQSVVEGEEKERERIARELHDGVMAEFSALKMNMSMLPRLHASLENSHEFKYMISQLDHATHELRKTAHNLMPDVLVEKGLGAALAFFCDGLNVGHSLHINFQQYGELPRLEAAFELMVYRTVQELVQNIVKHANASSALIQIDYMNHLLSLTIEDNGRGFPEGFMSCGKGKGLNNIRKRIETVNGAISFHNRSEGGAAVNIEFDLEKVIRQKMSANVNHSNDHG